MDATITHVENKFTGYSAVIRTKGLPEVSTIQRHLSAAKADKCCSVTRIFVNGVEHELIDLGQGIQLIRTGH